MKHVSTLCCLLLSILLCIPSLMAQRPFPQSGAESWTIEGPMEISLSGKSNNADGILHLIPGKAGYGIAITVEQWNVACETDYLYVFEGPNAEASLEYAFSCARPDTIQASPYNTSGALTLRYVSSPLAFGSHFRLLVQLVPLAGYLQSMTTANGYAISWVGEGNPNLQWEISSTGTSDWEVVPDANTSQWTLPKRPVPTYVRLRTTYPEGIAITPQLYFDPDQNLRTLWRKDKGESAELFSCGPGSTSCSPPVSMSINAIPRTICQGDSTRLVGNASTIGFFEDFSGATLSSTRWNTAQTNGTINSDCGCPPAGVSSGCNTLYFNRSTAGIRTATTVPIDARAGGTLSFWIILGPGGTRCESPDVCGSEEVFVDYSNDGGVSWIRMHTFTLGGGPAGVRCTNITSPVSTLGPDPWRGNWTFMNIPIDPAAHTPSTLFRFRQNVSSGNLFDNWAIDDVRVNTGTFEYEWSPAAHVANPTRNETKAAPPTTTTYTLCTWLMSLTTPSRRTCCQCENITVTVEGVTAGPNISICAGQSGILSASGVATYRWTPATGLSNPNIANPTANPAATTTYTVTGTTQSGCSSTATVTVTVIPPVVVSISADPPIICPSRSTPLRASGADSYRWSPGTGLSAIDIRDPVASPSSTTTYSVIGTTSGCTGSSTITITVRPAPIVNINASLLSICPGNSSTLTATGLATYNWTPTGETTSAITVSPTTSTSYTVNGRDAAGCTGSASVTITVLERPLVNAFATPSRICAGQSTTLAATSVPTVAAFRWSNGFLLPTFVESPTTTTTYTVTGTSANGCSNSASVTVTVNSLPRINIATPTPAICAGQSATLTASGGVSYTWNDGTTTNPRTVSPLVNTNYSVIGRDANGCTNSASIDIRVTDLPAILINAPTTSICLGDRTTLTATGGTSYTWSTGATSTSINVSPATTTTFTVTGSIAGGSSGSCSNTASLTLTVLPLPTVRASAVPDDICAGESSTISASGASTYRWDSGETAAVRVVNPTGATFYDVRGTDTAGCSNTARVLVNVRPLPNVNISATDATICEGQSTTLTASGANSYVWSTSATSTAIDVSPATSTSYNVAGTSLGCTDTDTFFVTVVAAPVAPIISDQSICAGQDARLTPTGPAGVEFLWYNNPGAITPILVGNTVIRTGLTAPDTLYLRSRLPSGCISLGVSRVIVSIEALPPAPDIDNDNSCLFFNKTLTPRRTDLLYNFYDESGNLLARSVSSYTTPLFTTAGTYRYSVESVSAANCTSATRTPVAIVARGFATPIQPITPINVGCVRLTSSQFRVNTVPGATYDWQITPAPLRISGNGTSSIIVNWGTTSGNYTVSVTPKYDCGSVGIPVTTTVRILAAVPPPILNATRVSTCIGTSTSFSATPQPETRFRWTISPAVPGFPQMGNSITVNWTRAGRYLVTATPENDCGTGPGVTSVVDVLTSARPVVSGPTTTCGTGVTLSSTIPPLGRIEWQFESGPITPTTFGLTAGSTSILAISSLTMDGEYRFSVIGHVPTCPSETTVVVIRKSSPPAIPVISPSVIELCEEREARITVPTPTDGTGSWTVLSSPTPTRISTTGTSFVFEDLTKPGNYVYRYSVRNACGTSSSDVRITKFQGVEDFPFANADQDLCNESSTVLVGWPGPPPGGTAFWEFISGPSVANITTMGLYGSAVNMNVPGEYVFAWVIKGGGPCPAVRDIVRVRRWLRPIATAAFPQTICTSTVSLTSNVLPLWMGNGEWSYVTGPSPRVNVSAVGSAMTAFTLDVPGDYTFRWAVSNPACVSANADVRIVVSQPSNAGGLSGGGTYCAGSATGVLRLGGFNGFIRRWEALIDGTSGWVGLSTRSDQLPYVNLSRTTSYRVVVQAPGCAEATSNVVTVTVVQAPTASVPGPFATCDQSISITASAVPTGAVADWTLVSSPAAAVWTASGADLNVSRFTVPGRYVFRYRVTQPLCSTSATASAVIDVLPVPNGGSISGSRTWCTSVNSGVLSLTGYTGRIVRWESWPDDASDWAPLAHTSPILTYINLSTTTRYRALIEQSPCGRVYSGEAVIRITPPAAANAGPDQVLCDETALLTGNTPGPGASSSWRMVSGPNTPGFFAFSTNLLLTSLVTGEYWLEYTVSDPSCGTSTDLVRVTVSSGSVGGRISGGGTFCAPAAGSLRLTGHIGRVIGWEMLPAGATSWIPIANTLTVYRFASLATTTQFRAVVQEGSCPIAYAIDALVQVLPAEMAIAPAALSTCGTEISLVGNTATTGRASWRLVAGPSTVTIVGSSTAVALGLRNGTYVFEYQIDNDACGISSAYTSVTVSALPTAGLAGGEATVCRGDNSGLIRLSGYSGSILYWEAWTDPPFVLSTIANTFDYQGYHRLTQTTTYRAVLGGVGCPTVKSNPVRITVIDAGNGIPCQNAGGFFRHGEAMHHSAQSWSIYPNPTTGVALFTGNLIEAQTVALKAYDASGRVVWSFAQPFPVGPLSVPIDLQDLPNGMYLLHVKGDSMDRFIKIVKQD
jgi:hypothetical protein